MGRLSSCTTSISKKNDLLFCFFNSDQTKKLKLSFYKRSKALVYLVTLIKKQYGKIV